LNAYNTRLFDVESLTTEIRRIAEAMAQAEGLTIEFIRKKTVGKKIASRPR